MSSYIICPICHHLNLRAGGCTYKCLINGIANLGASLMIGQTVMSEIIKSDDKE